MPAPARPPTGSLGDPGLCVSPAERPLVPSRSTQGDLPVPLATRCLPTTESTRRRPRVGSALPVECLRDLTGHPLASVYPDRAEFASRLTQNIVMNRYLPCLPTPSKWAAGPGPGRRRRQAGLTPGAHRKLPPDPGQEQEIWWASRRPHSPWCKPTPCASWSNRVRPITYREESQPCSCHRLGRARASQYRLPQSTTKLSSSANLATSAPWAPPAEVIRPATQTRGGWDSIMMGRRPLRQTCNLAP